MRPRFVALVGLFLSSGFVSAQPGARPAEDVAATVNGEPITLAELDAILTASLPATPLTPAQRHQLRAALLNDLIDEKLLRQFLAKNAPKADPAVIEAQLTTLKAQLIKENRTLSDFLKQTGQTEALLREEWALQIQLANYVKQSATDDKLKAYHAANRDHFDKVEVRISHIVIRMGKTAPAVERAAAKEKLQAIRADIAAGKTTFAAAARKFSQCPSAFKNGDLGFIRRRGLPENEPLARAAFALKAGGLSEIVETEHGLHLLTVMERKPGVPSVLEKCVVEVLEAYTEDVRSELVAKLRQQGQIRVTLP